MKVITEVSKYGSAVQAARPCPIHVVSSMPARIKACAQLKGSFILRSGRTSDTYFDKYRFEADPILLRDIATEMAKLVPEDTEVLAGLEMGGIPLVTLLSQVTGIPAAFIRKTAKPYGTCKYAEGADLPGKRFVLVEDVVSSGGAIIDALRLLRADGLSTELALCVIDRQSGAVEALTSAGVELKALFTFDQIADA